jgi:hypothetical protein
MICTGNPKAARATTRVPTLLRTTPAPTVPPFLSRFSHRFLLHLTPLRRNALHPYREICALGSVCRWDGTVLFAMVGLTIVSIVSIAGRGICECSLNSGLGAINKPVGDGGLTGLRR